VEGQIPIEDALRDKLPPSVARLERRVEEDE
jgi:hypothetical protein